jgi:hypothetical protein
MAGKEINQSGIGRMPKPRVTAGDNTYVNPINGPIAKSDKKPDRGAWSEAMDGIAEGDFTTPASRIKNIQAGAKAAVKFGVSKDLKDGVSKSKANLDSMLKPYRSKKK